MKLFLKVIVLVSLLLTVSVPTASQSKRFNPDGSFWLIGEPPNGFLDFGGINLNGRRLRRLPSHGLQLVNGMNFHFKKLIVRQNNFSFTTENIGGFHYTFSGKFLRGGVFAEQDLSDEQPVLEGVLTKYKSGKKLVQAKLKFSYFGGT